MATITLFVNGRILSKAETGLNGAAHFSDSMVVQGDKIVAIGSRHDIAQGLSPDVEVRDLNQRVVLPGFIDGHMHLLLLGQSLRKLDLSRCKSLEEIRSRIRQYAVENPETPTILCTGWRHHMTPDGVTAAMLDDLDPRPIFVDSGSLHSCWCNTAALKELEVADMPDPAGGRIYRDADGKPSGLLDEGAMMSISKYNHWYQPFIGSSRITVSNSLAIPSKVIPQARAHRGNPRCRTRIQRSWLHWSGGNGHG